MTLIKNETCLEYYRNRLAEGWRVIKKEGYLVTLKSPDGIIKDLDLRNDILTLRPNADVPGEINLSHYPSEGGNWDKVDDVTPDEDDTYVYIQPPTGGTADGADLYDIPDTTISGTINSVTIYIRCKTYEVGQAKTRIKTYGVVYEGNLETLSESYSNYNTIYDTNPRTGLSWTWDEINSLQIGVYLYASATDPFTAVWSRCTQVYIEIDYTSVPPPSPKHPITHLDKGPHPRSRLGFLPRLSL